MGALVCVLGAIIIGTPITYYSMNNRSFRSMNVEKFSITVFINILVTLIIGMHYFFS
ncbi:putative uncharacterized protein [Tetragenococcus halophilus subsp. halophilus]|uniref:Uncharacterized protein n=1 Tax=Tetragenococcus halophilus (strain DSM 20338 / JCM 20259 / NCIMB 9735 / NBRC 12172) TaxID=945021 RepID=A0AAN1SH47_TETHN|nr:hypothetical protein TEH_10740 [Tetragenococcus halophilus NBRC 12172]GBD62054.1 putative uncharacterized protein [Tetragenococcus halophilus subsp. halophilus]GFK21126.1 hypothetical protein WJ7_05890 [Tetragenococcus halophilus]GMA43064.1 hypothetical protein GCM10025853_05210 [Tetragenococcus halophilus subsp. halophilus DSM 20339]GBD71558.1 putative uncharacterized protein [Tetragenococcus halophilus subsp. halophilus]